MDIVSDDLVKDDIAAGGIHRTLFHVIAPASVTCASGC